MQGVSVAAAEGLCSLGPLGLCYNRGSHSPWRRLYMMSAVVCHA